MLFRIVVLLAALGFQGGLAQDCVPEHVGSIWLDLNYVLHWRPSTNCEDVHYLIYIHIFPDNLQYIFTSDVTHLDVAFLPACERFQFLIRAYSEHELSEERLLEAYMPAPSGTNLTIDTFDLIEQDNGILLNWEVNDKFAHCAQAFRVVIRDDWFAPRDVYTQAPSFLLTDVVPCAIYEFTVTAIYNQQSEGPIVLKRYEAPAVRTRPPDLQAVSRSATSAVMTYNLESFATNRCPITAVLISGQFYTQTYPVTDSPQRPPVELTASPLQPDSMYFLDVHVVNSAGTSSPLRVGIQTAAS